MADFTVMGVLNVTPDSFSDGGEWFDGGAAIGHGRRLIAEGAGIVDVGGESTRPGAEPVPAREELRRVVPVVEGLAAAGAQISVDTTKVEVARAAIAAGATYVNDVTALRDPAMADLVASSGADCCLMHMRGDPQTMQQAPHYEDVVDDVRAFLEQRAQAAIDAGVSPDRIHVDPGIGFGKTLEHNLRLLARTQDIVALGFPVVIGTSRKSFLGRITGRDDPRQRLVGTIASNVLAFARGARVFRVHDVGEACDALAVAAATLRADGA